MSKDEVFTKEYQANGHTITMVEHDEKAWILWSSFVGKKGFGGLPSAASLPAIADAAVLNLGVDFLKAPAPRVNGDIHLSWLASGMAISEILSCRDRKKSEEIFKEIFIAYDSFRREMVKKKNEKLLASGESETSTATSKIPPQDEEQETVDDSPELEVVEPTIKELSDKMDESMATMALTINTVIQEISTRIDKLEMVKYADQLGDMAERMSNFDERLYEFKAELADFRLVLRSVKEATGSQVQAESINQLIKMVDKLSQS